MHAIYFSKKKVKKLIKYLYDLYKKHFDTRMPLSLHYCLLWHEGNFLKERVDSAHWGYNNEFIETIPDPIKNKIVKQKEKDFHELL